MAKKIILRAVLCGLLLALTPSPALAVYLNGNDLMRSCSSDNKTDILACMNYIAGVIDYQTMMQSLGTEPTTDFCLPKDLPIQKAAVAVMLYMKKAPQNGAFVAAPMVGMALQQAYPCAPPKPVKKKRK